MGTLGSLRISIWRSRSSFETRETYGRSIHIRYNPFFFSFPQHYSYYFQKKDPPIKRFAQRHMYLGIDAIADRDLGFALARKATAANPLGKSETQQSLISSSTPQGTKRVASPDYRNKREDNNRGVGGGGGGGGGGGSGGTGGDYNQGNKRMRPSSPPRGVDRDRETRWEGPSRRRPFSPPPTTSAWDRDDRPRAREPLPPSRTQEREEEKPRQPSIPPVISWFVGDLPGAASFDGDCFLPFPSFSSFFFHGNVETKAQLFFFLIGPVFRTDDLLNLFRNAVIPSMTTRPKSPPVPPRSGQSSSFSSESRVRRSFTKGGGGGGGSGGGRPPPDYGPYQGPNSGRGGRRY